ncbi:MAG TPA: ATP-binding protein, partial [Kofleriaceae bacterium]
MADYDCDSIQVLTGPQAVRKRPGMYIGDTTNGSGLHHMLWEVVGEVIDHHVTGNASELRVELSRDGWVSVHDDGPGIPTDLMPRAPGSTRNTGQQETASQRSAGQQPTASQRSAGHQGTVRQRSTGDGDASQRSTDDEDDISLLEAFCTRLHCGTTRDGRYPHVHVAASLHG